MRLLLVVVCLFIAGCSTVQTVSWGDPTGTNYYMSFVKNRPWNAAIVVNRAVDKEGHVFEPTMLATGTGMASGLGGDVTSEASKHLVFTP